MSNSIAALPVSSAVATAEGEDQAAVQTLDSLNFNSLIGSPLVAGINASAQAAMATAEYIQAMGFQGGSGSDGQNQQLKTVSFTYTANLASGPVSQTVTVPLLSILPIPYLRVDSMQIDFKAKINSIASVKNTNTFGTTNSVTGSTGGFLSMFESAHFDVTVADQNVNTQVAQQTSNFSLDVKVHAGVDALPSGMQKVLNIFESLIVPTATPAAAQNAGGSTDNSQAGTGTDDSQSGGSTDDSQSGGSTDGSQSGGNADGSQSGGSADESQSGGNTGTTSGS